MNRVCPTSDTALVTGGAGGIGLAIASELANRGMRLVVADLALPAAQAAVQRLGGEGHLAVALDVSQEASVRKAFEEAEAQCGPIRVLVSCAGLLLPGPNGTRASLFDIDVENWDRTFAVNARGAFLCCQRFMLLRRSTPVPHARVITISSVAAQLGGYRSSAAYVSSKSAILGLTKAVAREGAEFGITANAVAPGLIDAPMLHQATQGARVDDKSFELVPARRLGTAGEVAGAVAFLADASTDYVTGSVIDVNGGYRMQ